MREWSECKPLAPDFPLSKRELGEVLDRLLPVLGLSGQKVELEIKDDSAMAELNLAFLGLPGPTNVLSFPSEEPGYLGEIALGYETVAREAALYGQDPYEHFLRMLCHALLHLAGLDHGPEMEQATENSLELMLGSGHFGA